jgi:hypothetical protein
MLNRYKMKYQEILFDYTDDNGVTHIDAFVSDGEGETIGWIFNGEPYFKDNDMRADKEIMQLVNEFLGEEKKLA